MSFEPTSFPEIVELPRLLDDMARGYLLLPRAWQRWAWSDEQRLELLRSVRDGLPIGAPLVWRTRARMPIHRRLAGRSVPRVRDGALVQYVLDGMHRLATLWSAFAPPTTDPELTMKPLFAAPQVGVPGGPDLIDARRSEVWLDLRAGGFRFGDGGAPWMMPLWLTFDGRGLRHFQRGLERAMHGEPQVDAMLRRADDFSVSAARFRVPFQVMATDERDRLVAAMQRSGDAAAEGDRVAVVRGVERAVIGLHRHERAPDSPPARVVRGDGAQPDQLERGPREAEFHDALHRVEREHMLSGDEDE